MFCVFFYNHLDNIIIDLYKKGIVHIDYNICFDKVKRLKIPKIVPFHHTHTIDVGLGFACLMENHT